MVFLLLTKKLNLGFYLAKHNILFSIITEAIVNSMAFFMPLNEFPQGFSSA